MQGVDEFGENGYVHQFRRLFAQSIVTGCSFVQMIAWKDVINRMCVEIVRIENDSLLSLTLSATITTSLCILITFLLTRRTINCRASCQSASEAD